MCIRACICKKNAIKYLLFSSVIEKKKKGFFSPKREGFGLGGDPDVCREGKKEGEDKSKREKKRVLRFYMIIFMY